LERKFIEQNTQLKKEYEQKLEELKKSAEEDIDERLDASVKRILQQNRRMASELRLHVQETDELQHSKRILEEEKKKLDRELGLKKEMEDRYAKRSAQQALEIREFKDKVNALEKSLTQVVADMERERKILNEQSANNIDEATSEKEGLKRLVKLKTQELKNIRKLAQEVLVQRSDVESFLVSSLYQVRTKVEKEHKRDESSSKVSNGQMDIRDLSWEDREKVLRLLFAKINNQARQAHFSNLPPHSFEVETQPSQFLPPINSMQQFPPHDPHQHMNMGDPYLEGTESNAGRAALV